MVTLKRFQIEAINELTEHLMDLHDLDEERKCLVVDSPTGSGKTTMILGFAARELQKEPSRRAFDTVLVLTPSQDIREGFTTGSPSLVVPAQRNVAGWELEPSPMIVVVDPNNRTRWVEEIQTHLDYSDRVQPEGAILVACHAAGVRFFKKGDLDSIRWDRVLIVIDEAHHVSVDYGSKEEEGEEEEEPLNPAETASRIKFEETKIGKLCREFGNRGATILMASATAFRADRMEQVYPSEARLVKVPYSVYVEEMGAPSQLHIDLVGPKDEFGFRDLRASTARRWAGDSSSYHDRHQDDIEGELSEADADRFARRIVKDGTGPNGEIQSKNFVKINRLTRRLPDDQVVPTKTIERLTAALKKHWPGVRIVDGTGDNNEKQFLAKLASERKKKLYADSEVDVFLVCGRAREGTDWKFCSHFYYIGLIGNIPYMIQVLGRTTRSKALIPDYPEHLRDHATLTMFAPVMNEKLASEVQAKWTGGLLLASCFIHSHEIAQHFIDAIHLRIRTSTQNQQPVRRLWARLMSRLNHAMPTPDEFAQAAQALSVLEPSFVNREGHTPSVPEIIEEITNHPTLPPRIKTAAVLLRVAHHAKETGVDREIQRAVKTFVDTVVGAFDSHTDTAPDLEVDLYNQYLQDAFKGVASKWHHLSSMHWQEQLEIEAKVHSRDLEKISQDFQARVLPDPPYKQVVRVVKAWYTKNGNSGFHVRGDLSELMGRPPGSYSGATLRRHLKQGLEGQPREVRGLQDLLHHEHIIW